MIKNDEKKLKTMPRRWLLPEQKRLKGRRWWKVFFLLEIESERICLFFWWGWNGSAVICCKTFRRRTSQRLVGMQFGSIWIRQPSTWPKPLNWPHTIPSRLAYLFIEQHLSARRRSHETIYWPDKNALNSPLPASLERRSEDWNCISFSISYIFCVLSFSGIKFETFFLLPLPHPHPSTPSFALAFCLL